MTGCTYHRQTPGSTARQRASNGFTLIELLVVVAIIATLLSILLPALSHIRDSAKKAACASNLGQLGKGFMAYSVENNDYLCSGQADPRPGFNYPASVTDPNIIGIDRVGWLADLVRIEVFPAELLCPGNIARSTESFNEFPTDDALTAERYRDFVARGFNTNYTQSWYMVHTEARDLRPLPPYDKHRSFASSLQGRWDVGPLQTSKLVHVPPTEIPLLADGRQDANERVTASGLNNNILVAEAVNDGPRWVPYEGIWYEFESGRFGSQDYTDFGPAHGEQHKILASPDGSDERLHSNSIGNILFADGHVNSFKDRYSVQTGRATVDAPDGRLDTADLEGHVFDGIISLGRRSASAETLE